MRLSQFSIISGGVIFGFALGLILAPALRPTAPANASPPQGKSAAANRTSAITDAPGYSPSRTRVRDREPAKKPDEPRISIPLKAVVELVHYGILSGADFRRLGNTVDRALETLGSSQSECDEIKDLIKKSKDEIYAAEKTHFKLGRVTPDHIEIDTSGIQEPVAAIIGRLQDGIRATLNPEAADVLVSAIDWKFYYLIDEKSTTSLEINRNETGTLMAWVRTSKGVASGSEVDKKFPDDGTPLPAEQIFPELWRPHLKGLTLVPRDAK